MFKKLVAEETKNTLIKYIALCNNDVNYTINYIKY